MERLAKTDKRVGKSFPLGASVYADGVNFSVFSKNATGIGLLLFDAVDDSQPAQVISLGRRYNRTFHYWHVSVPGTATGNWQWRVEKKRLTKKLAMQLSTETQTFDRLP